jgi:hypothetical protein
VCPGESRALSMIAFAQPTTTASIVLPAGCVNECAHLVFGRLHPAAQAQTRLRRAAADRRGEISFSPPTLSERRHRDLARCARNCARRDELARFLWVLEALIVRFGRPKSLDPGVGAATFAPTMRPEGRL